MNLLISTNMYGPGELHKLVPYLLKYKAEGVGAEIFPLFHAAGYSRELDACLDVLKSVPISFHGPYYEAEHSAPKGSPSYRHTMTMVDETLKYARLFDSRYLVFHHSNCRVDEAVKQEMLETAHTNFEELELMFGYTCGDGECGSDKPRQYAA